MSVLSSWRIWPPPTEVVSLRGSVLETVFYTPKHSLTTPARPGMARRALASTIFEMAEPIKWLRFLGIGGTLMTRGLTSTRFISELSLLPGSIQGEKALSTESKMDCCNLETAVGPKRQFSFMIQLSRINTSRNNRTETTLYCALRGNSSRSFRSSDPRREKIEVPRSTAS